MNFNTHVNGLTPPSGTTFFDCEDIMLRNGPDPEYPGGFVHWWITVYKYCTGALPTDPDFAKKRGAIIIVIVHHGCLLTETDNWTRQEFQVECDGESTRLIRTFPASYTGVKNADDSVGYGINFEISLQLYKNRGHETFVFPAQFKETFTRMPKTEATLLELPDAHIFSIKKEHDVNLHGPAHPIRALSVLKCDDPSKTLTLKFKHSEGVNSQKGKEFMRLVDFDLSKLK